MYYKQMMLQLLTDKEVVAFNISQMFTENDTEMVQIDTEDNLYEVLNKLLENEFELIDENNIQSNT